MPSILYQKEVHKIRRWVNNWQTISQMMWLKWQMDDNIKENFYFSLEIAQMIKIWEETWNTLWVLKKISEVNTSKLNNIVKNLTSMLEPLITVVIWWMVWTLIIAFMIPMMSSFKNVG
jgi:type II secretory pathway component PulF